MPRSFLALFVLLSSTACATAGARIPPVPVAELSGLRDRDCRYLAHPDSVRGWPSGAAALVAWQREDRPTPARAVTLSVRYDHEGSVEWVREVGTATADGQRLVKEIASVLPATGRPAAGVRLRFSPDQPPGVLPGIACEATLPPGARFISGPPLGLDYSQLPRGGSAVRYTVDVSVGRDGHPSRAVVRGRSAVPGSIEAHLVGSAMAHRYLPALHDGFPVPGTYTYSLKVGIRAVRVPGER